MSVVYSSNKDVASKTFHNPISLWSRPSDWLTLTPVGASESRFTGLYAVFSDDKQNQVSLAAAGNYTVDWGDGVVENFAANATATHTYTFSAISNSTLTSQGFKQVIITVTPQSGQNFTTINLRTRPNGVTVGCFAQNWLDIEFGSPNLTSSVIGANNNNVSLGLVKRLRFVSKSAAYTSFSDWLYLLYNLEECIIDANMSNVTNMNSMFYSCSSLRVAPMFDTSSATLTTNMFQLCRNLVSVPQYNLRSCTNLTNMFADCSNLSEVFITNLANVTSYNTLFQNCTKLQYVPALDCSNANTMVSVFSGCVSLPSVTLQNASKVTNLQATFNNCNSLDTINLDITSANILNTTNMFTGCSVLSNAPTFDTTKVTTTASMFSNCRMLKQVPLYNLSNSTSTNGMFSGCSILESVPDFNTSNVTNMSSMFADCNGLIKAPSINTYKVTSVTNMFSSCRSLTSIPNYNLANVISGQGALLSNPGTFGSVPLTNLDVTGLKFTINISTGFLGRTELESVFDNLGIAAASQTITISGNPGADTAISRSCTFTTNQVVLANTGIQAAGVTTGMFASGTGVTSSVSVNVVAATDRITSTVISSWPTSSIGGRVSFTTTANGITANQIYYIVAAVSNYIQVSLTPGGAPIDITSDGAMTMNMENQVVGVSTNDVTLAFPTTQTTTATISFRLLNTNIARLKNWTVSG